MYSSRKKPIAEALLDPNGSFDDYVTPEVRLWPDKVVVDAAIADVAELTLPQARALRDFLNENLPDE